MLQRDEYTSFPFHRLWEKAQKEVYEGDQSNAKRLFLDLSGQVATCTDITQDQRYDLIRLYKANFEKDLALARELRGAGRAKPAAATRGAGASEEPRAAVKWTAQLAHAARASEDAVEGLLELQNHWDRIPGLEPADKPHPVTDSVIKAQLDALKGFSRDKRGDPVALADALALVALTGKEK